MLLPTGSGTCANPPAADSSIGTGLSSQLSSRAFQRIRWDWTSLTSLRWPWVTQLRCWSISSTWSPLMLPSTTTRRRSSRLSLSRWRHPCARWLKKNCVYRFIRSLLPTLNRGIRRHSALWIGLCIPEWVTFIYSKSALTFQKRSNIILERSFMKWLHSTLTTGRPISTWEFWQKRSLR